MAKSRITEQDLDSFRDVFRGERPLKPAITNAYDYVYYKPGKNDAHLRKYQYSMEDNLNALKQHAHQLNSKLQPDEKGFLTTPEFFLSNRRPSPLSSKKGMYQYEPIDRQIAKRELAALSRQYPNIMFAPTGYYHKPVDRNNPLKRQKFENQIESFVNRSYDPNTQQFRAPFVEDANPAIKSFYEDFFRKTPEQRRDMLHGEGGEQNLPWNKIKNQRDFYLNGEKLGSYKKRTYANEVTPNFIPQGNLGWTPGMGRIGDIKPNYIKEKGPNYPHNQLANLLAHNTSTRTCYDNLFCGNGPFPANNKKLSLLAAADVDILRPENANLGIQADKIPLNQFVEPDASNPPEFTGPLYSPFGANFLRDQSNSSSIIPNTGQSPEAYNQQSYEPFFWPLSTMNQNQPPSMHPMDTSDPVFFHPSKRYGNTTDNYIKSYPFAVPEKGNPSQAQISQFMPTHQFFNFNSYRFPQDNNLAPSRQMTPGELNRMQAMASKR